MGAVPIYYTLLFFEPPYASSLKQINLVHAMQILTQSRQILFVYHCGLHIAHQPQTELSGHGLGDGGKLTYSNKVETNW